MDLFPLKIAFVPRSADQSHYLDGLTKSHIICQDAAVRLMASWCGLSENTDPSDCGIFIERGVSFNACGEIADISGRCIARSSIASWYFSRNPYEFCSYSSCPESFSVPIDSSCSFVSAIQPA